LEHSYYLKSGNNRSHMATPRAEIEKKRQ